MIVLSKLPRQAVIGQAGATLVATKNNADPTNGIVPLRQIGDVGRIKSDPRYINSKVHDFHRYAQVDIVGSFDSAEHAEAAWPEAERLLRINPAPDVNLSEPIGTDPSRRVVYAMLMRMGPILSHWDPESQSVINETTPKHEMRDGFVVRQVSRVGRNLFVTTFGEGVNTSALRAYANGTLGPIPFFGMDVAVNRGLTKTAGFLPQVLPGPSGSNSAYPFEPQPFLFYIR